MASGVGRVLWISYAKDLHFVCFPLLEELCHHWYNAGMRKTLAFSLFLFFLSVVVLPACAPAEVMETVTPTPTLDGTLRPYPSATATATPLPTDYVSPTPSPTITPTPTPVYYEVREGDDMYSIAWRYNLSPDMIMTANPTVNPRAMGIGTSLLIPITPMPESTPTPMVILSPTATPRYSTVRDPDCYPDAVGGLWCFMLVENDEDQAVENISAVVELREGADTRREIAILPLNLLPPGTSLPLIAYFQPPIPEAFSVSAWIDFYLPVMPDDQRYLRVDIENQTLQLTEDARVAAVSGMLFLPAGQPETRYLWINATAFDQDDHVVAVRRWDSPTQISGGERIPFELFLYSMGGAIDRVDLQVEAQPMIFETPEEESNSNNQ